MCMKNFIKSIAFASTWWQSQGVYKGVNTPPTFKHLAESSIENCNKNVWVYLVTPPVRKFRTFALSLFSSGSTTTSYWNASQVPSQLTTNKLNCLAWLGQRSNNTPLINSLILQMTSCTRKLAALFNTISGKILPIRKLISFPLCSILKNSKKEI